MANIERLYEYWDELYNQYGSALHDVLDYFELERMIIHYENSGLDAEELWSNVFPALLAAEDELSAETLDLMEGCYGREE